MALTSAEQANLVKTYAEVSVGVAPFAQTVRVWGSVGTLTYLGMSPETNGLLADAGIDRTTTRKAHKRSRWLGDRNGSSINENTATTFLYPSRKGSALPGTPVKILNMNARTPSGGRKAYTVQVDGPIGTFVSWLTDHPRPFPMKIVGKTGNSYSGIIPAD